MWLLSSVIIKSINWKPPSLPPSNSIKNPSCVSFTCIFKLMNLSSILNGGSLIKSILWQFSSGFKAFDALKTTFLGFLGSQKLRTLSFAHNKVAVFISFYGWILTDSEVFIWFAEINWILFQISLILIYLAYMYLGALYQKNKM